MEVKTNFDSTGFVQALTTKAFSSVVKSMIVIISGAYEVFCSL